MKPRRVLVRVAGVAFVIGLLPSASSTFSVGLDNPPSARPTRKRFQRPGPMGLIRRIIRKGAQDDPPEDQWSPGAVSEKELQELLDSPFLTRCHTRLYSHVRKGQEDLGIRVPETVGDHTQELLDLADLYSQRKGLSPKDTLVLKIELKIHDIGEVIAGDAALVSNVPKSRTERKSFIERWVAPTRREEQARWIKEYQEERPFFRTLISGLNERQQQILTDLFDDFYVGKGKVAKLARQLHYLQPPLNIWTRTRSEPIRDMFFRRAENVLTDSDAKNHLERVYGRLIGRKDTQSA